MTTGTSAQPVDRKTKGHHPEALAIVQLLLLSAAAQGAVRRQPPLTLFLLRRLVALHPHLPFLTSSAAPTRMAAAIIVVIIATMPMTMTMIWKA